MTRTPAAQKVIATNAPSLAERAMHFRRYADEIRELLADMAEQNELRRTKLAKIARQYTRLAERAEVGGPAR